MIVAFPEHTHLLFANIFFKFYLVAALLYLLIRFDISSGSSAGR